VLLTERHGPERWGRRALGLRPTHPALAVLGLGLGLALYVPVEAVRGAVERWQPTPHEQLAERAFMLSADSPVRAALVVLIVGCAMPLVEEIFFRGALFGALRVSHAPIGAALVTAVCYMIGHIDLRVWPSALMIGLVASYLRLYSGSTLPALAFNVGLGSVGTVALVQGISSVWRPLDVPWFVELGASGIAVALLFAVQRIALRSEQAARARDEDGDE
jgi:membrane protease YdiL (CAAX protease family)